jgi:hypothetical protein
MAKEYLISITGNVASVPTTVWLTRDGTNTGARCRTDVPNADALFAANSGNTTVASGGVPWTERPLANGGGRPIEIHFRGTLAASGLFASLKALIADADANDGEFTITFAGDPGSVTVLAAINYAPVPFSWGKFAGGRIKDVVARFITKPNS